MKAGGDLFVVDDHPDNLTLLTGLLREAGHRVRVANSGRRALAAIRAKPPELVLLDISMPDLDGYAVCRELKADPETKAIPVLFLSARDDVGDKLAAFRAGGVDYVTKPFQSEEVLARVDTQLRLTRLHRALEEKNAALSERNAELERARALNNQLFGALAGALSGTVIDDRYRLGERLGTGASAVVYRGERLADGAAVAVKVLRPRPGEDPSRQHALVLAELEAARAVEHPHVVEVYDFGVTGAGIAYLVMQLLVGRTLATLLEDQPRLELPDVARILSPVAAALAAAHAKGYVHRDVKPANVFLARREGVEQPVLVDFGLARPAAPGDVELKRLLGTPIYMAPEVLLGQQQDRRVDVYALGMIAYRALDGGLPFAVPEGGLGGLLVACVSAPLRPLSERRPDVPPGVEELIMRALSRRPVERPEAAHLAAIFAALAAPREAPGLGETVDQGQTAAE